MIISWTLNWQPGSKHGLPCTKSQAHNNLYVLQGHIILKKLGNRKSLNKEVSGCYSKIC